MRRVLGVLVLGALFAGCGGGSEGEGSASGSTSAPPPSSTVESPTTTTQPRSDEEAILAAVQGYRRLYLIANNPPNPDHPDIERLLTGNLAARFRENVANRRSLGQAIRLPEDTRFETRARVTQIAGASAEVVECVVDDSQLLDVPSGQVLNAKVSTFKYRLTLRDDGEGWRVGDQERLERWDGVAPCDL